MSEKTRSAEAQPSKSIAEEHLVISPNGNAELSDSQIAAVSGGLSPRRVTGIEPIPTPPSPVPIPYPIVSKP